MATNRDGTVGSGSGDDNGSGLGRIIAEYLDRLNSGQHLDPKQILAENPGLGNEIIEGLQGFIDLGTNFGQTGELGTLGDYTLRRQIGRGGMGVVYEAWQNSMNRQVALKVLPKAIAVDTRAAARFIQEAQVAGKLSHPNIVHVNGMGVEEQVPYFAMEFVEGETLAQVLARLKEAEAGAETPFGAKDEVSYFGNVAKAFAEVADGLQHAHSKGIIHRDIKPSNLILDRDGRLRILDFGLARLEGQESLTISGDVLGTPQYMSPEQARRKKIPVDHRTDVYSLGATLYEMLTLQPPFRGKDHEDTLSQIIERDPVEPRKVNPRVPKDLETIVLKCLRKDAGDRYGTAEACGQDLRRFVRGEVIEARPQAGWERNLRYIVRNRRRIAVALLVVLLAVVSTWQAFRFREDKRLREAAEYDASVRRAVLRLEYASLFQKTSAGESGIAYMDSEPLFPSLLNADPVVMAHRDLAQAEALSPGSPDAHYHRARAYLYQGNQLAALASLEAASPTGAPFIPALTLKASVLESRGDPPLARKVLAEASKLARSPWEQAWLEVVEGWRSRDFKAALTAYGKLIDFARDREPFVGCSLAVRMGRGAAAIEAEDYAQALREYTIAGSLVPGAIEPPLSEAKAWLLMGKKEYAESLLTTTWESASQRDEAAIAIVALYRDLKDADKRLEWIARIAIPSVREERLADAYFDLGRFEEAKRAAQHAFELDPRNAEATINLWFTLEGEHDHEEQIRILERGLEARPDSYGLLRRLGTSCAHTHRFRKALRHFERAKEVSPNPSLDDCYIACTLLRLGEAAQADQLIRKAQEGNPRHEYLYAHWSLALLNAGRIEESIAARRRLVEINPAWSWWHASLGASLLWGGQLDPAIECFRRAQECYPWSQDSFLIAAWAYEEKGKPAEALSQYLKILEKLPADAEAHTNISRHLRQAHESIPPPLIADAVTALEKATGQTPRSPLVWNSLALALEELGEPPPGGGQLRALAAAVRGCDLAEESGEFLDELGRTLRQVFEGLAPDEGCRLDKLPGLPSYVAMEELVAALEGEFELGRCGETVLEKWSTTGDQRSLNRARYLQALLLERRGKLEEATELLRVLVEGDNSRPEPLLALARVLRSRGDAAQAEAVLRAAIEQQRPQPRSVWERWLQLRFGDGNSTPKQILAELPRPLEGGGADARADDARWLLERLGAGDGVRVNCGGDEVTAPDGKVWGRDRFFLGGVAFHSEDIHVSVASQGGAEAVYKHARVFQFSVDPVHWGYRIPLPAGKYRVRLHFAEIDMNVRGFRRFDVWIQEREVLTDFDIVAEAGFRTALVKELTVELSGQPLSIRLAYRRGWAGISAIEVERME